MSTLKLFRLRGKAAVPMPSLPVTEEKSLQALIERHLHAILGIRFIASEYSTGRQHRGRIDTLGLDERGVPVIVEYKRRMSTSLINQGLFYLDWLLDHRAEFRFLAQDKFGVKVAASIDWSAPRLVCIAADYTRYDRLAVRHVRRHIEMVRYRIFAGGLMLFEFVSPEGSRLADQERSSRHDRRQRGRPRKKQGPGPRESTGGKT